ncbi:MAG: ATP-binding protein [Oligoflexia bacterium]|nr:ATP-binding protein [Oligoflexia bacterium]
MIDRWLKLNKSKSLLLLGARRAGKTTLLRNIFKEAHYITLDDFDFFQMAETDPKGVFENTKGDIIVDEIQRVPKLLIAVKNRIDNYHQKVFMTGSSSLGLLSKGTETLAGRIKICECPTLCYGEEMGPPLGSFLKDQPSKTVINEARRKLDSWLEYGGFPEVMTYDNEADKKALLKDYKNTFFTKDLLLISNIVDARGLNGCMNYLATSICSRIDVSSVAKESGLSHPTTKKYLNALEASRLAFTITGHQFGPAKRLLKSSKYYYSDISIPQSLGVRLSEGQMLELFVISELEKRRKLGKFDCDFFHYYETEKGKEIDLIIDEGSIITAIEIKNTSNPRKSDVHNLIDFSIKSRKVKLRKVLLCKSEKITTIEDVEVWPIYALYRHL